MIIYTDHTTPHYKRAFKREKVIENREKAICFQFKNGKQEWVPKGWIYQLKKDQIQVYATVAGLMRGKGFSGTKKR